MDALLPHTQPTALPDSRHRRALLLVNRNARSASEVFGTAADVLHRSGLELITPVLTDKTSAAREIRAHAKSCDLVIVAGGDGSLNAALQALVDADLPLGILPLGTANDLAKSLGIPTDLEGACAVITGGVERRIDIGRVNDVYYFNEMSVGLSTTVSRIVAHDPAKKRFGIIALAYRALQVMRRMRRFHAWVKCDDEPEMLLRTAQLTIGNSREFGGFVASDDASIVDHKLDLYSVSFNQWYSYFEVLSALVRRRYDDARTVVTLHGKQFRIRTHRPRPIEADGEIVSMTPAQVRVVPNAVAVMTPAKAPV
ncbi:MAG TPA: lipid kinase [Candidatus Eremiobacteraceae bacterium]|nr:lipid kinase [Candidatus Eremiobacteraceae bacterium]